MAIYKITNLLNNKVYIGQTTASDPMKRIKKHFEKNLHNNFYIQKAIQKYGKDNFIIDILENSIDIEELNILEPLYIEQYDCLSPNGYNLKKGGDAGGPCSEEVKQNISKAKKGKPNYKLLGKKFTKEHCEALSRVRKGFTSEARKVGRIKGALKISYAIIAHNSKTKETFDFISIEECAQKLNLTPSCISRVLRKDQNRTQHNGWTFSHKGINI